MKAKVTFTGTLDLSREDIKALRGLPAEHVLDTLRESKDVRIEIEGPEERTKAKADAKAGAETKAKVEAEK